MKIYTKLVNEVKSNMESETKRDVAERTLNERGGKEMAIRMGQQRMDGGMVMRHV